MWESVRVAKSQARHPTHIVCPRFCHGINPANGRQTRKRPEKTWRERVREKRPGEREKEKKTGEKTKSPRESEKDEERRWR
ncbi:hypothetical protein TNCV_334741 [Trichonephila clavipes]|nr:hypothetical protein TNCV_334741 [Trichonephila clavipes]